MEINIFKIELMKHFVQNRINSYYVVKIIIEYLTAD